MYLSDSVSIARRFQRSIRIDSDLNEPKALEGYVATRSSVDVLLSMAAQQKATNQGAFTWTGPYGCGKSSLVVVLAALLSGESTLRKTAVETIGRENAGQIWEAFPVNAGGWQVLPVVGRKERPLEIFSEILEACLPKDEKTKGPWSEKKIIDGFLRLADKKHNRSNGIILFLDEMGKCLEGAGQEGSDIYLFQQIAEVASRSNGRFIFVGVLHQAFQEYATQLTREMRDEWTKIQGRFSDLPVNVAGEEQIELLSRAIRTDREREEPGKLSNHVFKLIEKRMPTISSYLCVCLEKCWPLHPVVACLLGPISRRRFGQNQRSLFAFLNSAEPKGFQDFLRNAREGELYGPDRLWDYLRLNLEPSILASTDGHRWALAVEAIERCEGNAREELHLTILKTIALVDWLKGASGLVASLPLLQECCQERQKPAIKEALAKLVKWSLIIFRKFEDSYAVFSGSDFDIDSAIDSALEETAGFDFSFLRETAGLQPILAKRFYHETGSMFWMDVDLVPVSSLEEKVASFVPSPGSIGQFLLAIPTENEDEEDSEKKCRDAARVQKDWEIVAGFSPRSRQIVALTQEIHALERVRSERPELAGDAVARREILARLAANQSRLEGELRRIFDGAIWLRKGPRKTLSPRDLSRIASDLAEARFNKTPVLPNELLNRTKPSVSAVSGQNILLKKMVQDEGKERFGIEGFPAEGGICVSLLEKTGLYSNERGNWEFLAPQLGRTDIANLMPLWEATKDFLGANSSRAVGLNEIFDLWRKPPFGVKDGMMPLLVVAFFQTMREKVSFYRQGVFQTRFKELDVEYLVNDSSTIALRWMDISEVSRRLLSELASVVRELDPENKLTNLEPIDVARGLISIFDRLQPWTKRTTKLSGNAIKIRVLFNKAKDPNQFLFDDIPGTFGEKNECLQDEHIKAVVASVREGLVELRASYGEMLNRFKDILLCDLQVPNNSPQAMAELRERAMNIKQVAGDLRFDGFVSRLMEFDGSNFAIEGIASLVASKPLKDWVDQDLDRAMLELAQMTQKFIRLEAFARVQGRANKRHAMAVVVGVGDQPTTYSAEFDVSDREQLVVKELVRKISTTLKNSSDGKMNLQLAVLAQLGFEILKHIQQDVFVEVKEKMLEGA